MRPDKEAAAAAVIIAQVARRYICRALQAVVCKRKYTSPVEMRGMFCGAPAAKIIMA